MSDEVYQAQKWAWRAKQVGTKGRTAAEAPANVSEGIETAADPTGAVLKAKGIDSSADTGYVPNRMHTGGEMSSTQKRVRGESSAGDGEYDLEDRIVGRLQEAVQGYSGWKPSQHSWQGPGREALGGIDPGYDWRTFKQRQIESPSVAQAGRYADYKRSQRGGDAGAGAEEVEEAAMAPEVENLNFSPEQAKEPLGGPLEGMYASESAYNKAPEHVTGSRASGRPRRKAGMNEEAKERRRQDYFNANSTSGGRMTQDYSGNPLPA